MPVTARRGFSLVEMLMTTLILSLAMVIVVSGSSVAQKIYRNTMAKADAQMILSQIERNRVSPPGHAESVPGHADHERRDRRDKISPRVERYGA